MSKEARISPLDDIKLRLFGKVEGSTDRASLQFGLWNNNPQVTVWTGVKSDPDGGRITARLDPVILSTFIQRAFDFIQSDKPEDRKVGIYNRTHPRGEDGRQNTKEIVVDNLLQIARDDEGRLFMSVTNKKASAVRFYFEPNNYHEFMVNGGKATPKETSEMYAMGYLNLVYRVFQTMFIENYVPPQPRNQSNGDYRKPQAQQAAPQRPAKTINDDFADSFDMEADTEF